MSCSPLNNYLIHYKQAQQNSGHSASNSPLLFFVFYKGNNSTIHLMRKSKKQFSQCASCCFSPVGSQFARFSCLYHFSLPVIRYTVCPFNGNILTVLSFFSQSHQDMTEEKAANKGLLFK